MEWLRTKGAEFNGDFHGMRRAFPELMRRIKLFVACVLMIVVSLPLLPGPGAMVIAEMIAILEREFPWVARLMNWFQASSRRHDERRHPRRRAELLLHARRHL